MPDLISNDAITEPLPFDSHRGSEAGFSLIELLVATSITAFVGIMAATLLIFTQTSLTNVSRQVNINEGGRQALQKIMLELHSACVDPTEKPVRAGSNAESITFINARAERPSTNVTNHEEAFVKPIKHTLFYEPLVHRLVEYTYLLESEVSATGTFTFEREHVQATGHPIVVAENVVRAEEPKTHTTLPFFTYYRYYETGEEGYAAATLDPSPMAGELSEEEAKKVAEVKVKFAVAPPSTLMQPNKSIKSLTLEDAAVYRLSPVSTLETSTPQPCT